jgi:hypothetical protein
LAISRQNSRSTSRRSADAPGDFIGDRPVNAVIHPAGLPINTSTIEVLRRPGESTHTPGVGMVNQLVLATRGAIVTVTEPHVDRVENQVGSLDMLACQPTILREKASMAKAT